MVHSLTLTHSNMSLWSYQITIPDYHGGTYVVSFIVWKIQQGYTTAVEAMLYSLPTPDKLVISALILAWLMTIYINSTVVQQQENMSCCWRHFFCLLNLDGPTNWAPNLSKNWIPTGCPRNCQGFIQSRGTFPPTDDNQTNYLGEKIWMEIVHIHL